MEQGNNGNLAYANEEHVSQVDEAELKTVPLAVIAPSKRVVYPMMKRFFDVVLSALALAVLSPLFLITAIAIKAEDGGPTIHRRWCVGRNGSYAMLKFRTMVVDADNLEKYLTPKQIEEYKKTIKLTDDPRLTSVGRFLRKLSLDELPQLVNIFRGEMSVIGPRPVTKEEIKFYSEQEQIELLMIKPGLTGYWQTHGRSNCTYESGERQKLELYYIEHRSLWLDIKILFKTVVVVLSRVGAR